MSCRARLTFVALLLTVVNSTATSQEVSRPGLRFTDVSDIPGFVPTAMHAMGVEDFDGDGDLDLVCGGWPVAGGAYRSTIYRNDGGFKFTDVSPPHWAKIKPTVSGVAIGDVNGDGRADFVLTAVGGPLQHDSDEKLSAALCLNEGKMKFRDATRTHLPAVRTIVQGMGRSAALADVDNDGDLDLFIAGMTVKTDDGKTEVGTSALLLNDGTGAFTDATESSGFHKYLCASGSKVLGCAFADFDNDGDQDLCVTVFFTHDRLFANDGTGKFADVSSRFLNGNIAIKSASVGAAWGDVDNDGWLDLYVTTDSWVSGGGMSTLLYHTDRFGLTPWPNALYRNRNGKHFDLHGTLPQFLSEGHDVQFEDIDHDGDLDLYTTCHGFNNDRIGTRGGNPLFLNDGKGNLVRAADALGISPVENYVSGALVDLDQDGDLDVATAHFNSGHIKVYRNELNDKDWLTVRAVGVKSNRTGIGARVSVYAAGRAGAAGSRLAWREIQTTRGYCTATPALAHFGLDASKRYDVVVTFPATKTIVTRDNVAIAQTLTVAEE